MFKKIKAIIAAYKTAAEAGLIVANCKTGCELDNENEVVLACIFHERDIARLETLNAAADKQR